MTTTMDRWNPFREMLALRDVMDRMFEDTFYRSGTSNGERSSSFPIDLAETDQGFMLRATLPGVTSEQVQITIHGDTLTIRSPGNGQEEGDGHNWIIRERRGGSYHRMVTLPSPVNPDQAEAHFKDGILELTLPRAEAARPRQIKVAAGTGAVEKPATAATTSSHVAGSNGSAAKEAAPHVYGAASNDRGAAPHVYGAATGSDGSKNDPAEKPAVDDTPPTSGDTADDMPGGTASKTPPNPPSTHPDKDAVTEASEESMAASDPPSWTQERT